ncbi:MAG: phosphohistidine phosphatase SixA [Calditrichaeota bacterium]|nr:phosphohistidine phosphatase SixA [Calditrichota bacterium]MCB9369053.1 phosphohistidine phosphatase SixA [Calditrichota bacterium]
MYIYLVRHAIAVEHGTPGYKDSDRPLTEEGIERMQKAARGLAHFIDPPDLIVSSPYLRAKQTAEILAVALQSRDGITEWPMLTPASAPTGVFANLNENSSTTNSVMLVGHEPHISRLTALLLGTKSDAIRFKKGAVCALECPAHLVPGCAELQWFLTPKQLRRLA